MTITEHTPEYAHDLTHTGTVKKKTLEIGMHQTLDLVAIVRLQKQ